MKKYLSILFCGFMLAGCSSSMPSQTDVAMLQTTITPIHDSVTGLTTSKMATAMDVSDETQLKQLVSLASIHQTQTWIGSEGDMYEFTSLNIYVNDAGEPCRDYQLRALIDAREQNMQATACRIQGANWKIIKENTV